MDKLEIVAFWRKSAERDLDTASYLYKGKRYDQCLFFCHLALEKVLKDLYVKKFGEHPLPIHDLFRLTKLIGLNLSTDQETFLKEATTFNIGARYDNIRLDFHKKANKTYTDENYKKCKDVYIWLEKKL